MNLPRKSALADLKCGGCGGCCQEPIVALTDADLQRLVEATGRPVLELAKLFDRDEIECEKDDDDWVKLKSGRRMLGLRKKQGRCLFLSAEDTCTVYEHRPMTCRVYPMMLVFNEDDDSYDFGDFNAAGVETCLARTIRARDPERVRRLFTQMREERSAYWKLLRRWEKRSKRGGKRAFLRYLGFTVPSKTQSPKQTDGEQLIIPSRLTEWSNNGTID